MNYFQLFNLPENFSIDKEVLSKKFYKLQLIYHPDLFANDSTEKQKDALKKSIKINKSYQTLKDDLKRAIYLLKINGLDIHNNDFLSKKNCFLMKYFFLHEELEHFKKKIDTEAILLFSKKIENKIKKYTNQMHQALNNQNWHHGIIVVSKVLFFLKIRNKLKQDINQDK